MQTLRDPPKKTTSATFRISEEIYEALQEESRMKKTSVNTLINQLLDYWAESDRFLEEVGLVRITRSNFKKFLQALPEGKLADLGKVAGKNVARSYMMAKDGKISHPGLLHYLRGFAEYGGYAKYNETEITGKRVIVLMHELGTAGSVYISAYVQSLFELVGSQPVITTTENSVVVEL